MFPVKTEAEMREMERKRSLVGIYLDHYYSDEKLRWLLGARKGFDSHVESAWHLLVPRADNAYVVNETMNADDYGVELARNIIKKLKLKHDDLPCIIFRATRDQYFYLKLNETREERFKSVIGRLGDYACELQASGPEDPDEYREYVNHYVGNWLRREKLFSAVKESLPVLSQFLGSVIDLKELV